MEAYLTNGKPLQTMSESFGWIVIHGIFDMRKQGVHVPASEIDENDIGLAEKLGFKTIESLEDEDDLGYEIYPCDLE